MRLRRLVYVGSLVWMIFCIQDASPTLMLTSLLMALKGGLMVGKMSLGGLMMMLNAANENQKSLGRQNSIFGSSNTQNPFDLSLLTSLMSASHSNKVQVSTAGPLALAQKQQSGISSPISSPTSINMATAPYRLSKRRIIKKRINKRDVNGQISNATSTVEDVKGNGNATDATKEIKETPLQDAEIQSRIYRQISNMDPLMCLPKVMCGINSAPPSTKTTILNDYAYLMKTIFSRDDDKDDKKQDDIESSKKKKKNKAKNKKENKNDDNDTDETAEEEYALNDEDFERLALKEEDDIEALANDQMVDEEPGFLPFILKDTMKLSNGPDKTQEVDYPLDDMQGDLGENGYEGPSPYEQGYGHGPGHGRPRPPPHLMHKQSGEIHNRPQPTSGSLLSSFMPQFSFGKTKEGSKDAFSTDPFFSGFKRNMKSTDEKEITPAISKDQEQILKDISAKREKRNAYIQRKKRQLQLSTDPAEKFKIAAEIGQKLKSPRQCRAIFDGCPFKYTEVLSMINNLRKAIQGHPEVAATNNDQVVNLKTTQGGQIFSGSKNVINLSTPGGSGHGGITSISHQLPNGETVEINLKVLGHTPTTSTSTTTTTTTSTTPKTAATQRITTKATRLAPPKSRHPNDKEKVFDDDDEAIMAQASSQPFDAATVAGMRDRIHSIESLESLKATILAIEKINNATINRQKYGKPVTYSGVFHEVTGLIPPRSQDNDDSETVNDSTGSSSESDEDDEVDEDLPLNQQNEVPEPEEVKKPIIRLRPQVQHKQQQRIRPKPTPEPTTTPSTTTTTRIPPTPTKRIVKYKTRKPTVEPLSAAQKKNNSTYKIKKVVKKPDPLDEGIVPFTEKEHVANPSKNRHPQGQQLPQATSNKKNPNSNKEQAEDYDEEDVDGDENDNDTSEEDEDEEAADDEGDIEQRLNIKLPAGQNERDEDESEGDDTSRQIIKPAIHGNPSQQMPQRPHHPPPQQMPQRPHHPPPQQMPQRPHHPPPQQMPHPHQRPHHRPQRHSQVPPTKFLRRTSQVNRRRGKAIDSGEPTSEEKPKHPNHRYPCGVEPITTSTEKSDDSYSQDIQTTTIPEQSTTSTVAPPVLPYRYPKYASPHNAKPE